MNKEITVVAGRAPVHAKHRCMAIGLFAVFIVLASVTLTSPAAWAQVTLQSGDVVVADGNAGPCPAGQCTGGGQGAIIQVTPHGSQPSTQAVITSGNLLRQAVGVVADPNDSNLLVVDRYNGVIRVNPFSGTQTQLSSGGLFHDPFGITLDAMGQIFVADSGYRGTIADDGVTVITEVNTSGQIVLVNRNTGSQGSGPFASGGFINHPYGIAYDPIVQLLYVSDMSTFGTGAVYSIDPATGRQALIWGPASQNPLVAQVPGSQTPSTNWLGCPMGITVEGSGNILVSAFSAPPYGCANPGIFRINLMTGLQETFSANPPTGWLLPFGLATDASGNVLVGDEDYAAIYRLDPVSASFITPVPLAQGPKFSGAGQLYRPVGINVVKFAPTAHVDNGGTPPAVTINGAASSSPEGTAINLTGSVTPAGAYNYAWTVSRTANGVTTSFATGSAASLTFTPNLVGSYSVSLTVTPVAGGAAGQAGVTVSATDVAPTVTGVTGPATPLAAPAAASISASFTYAGTAETHTCTFDWNDGATSSTAATESNGSGSCTLQHTWANDNVYTVAVTVADHNGGSAIGYYKYVVVYNPLAGWVSGNGKISSPAGAYPSSPALSATANFGFVVKYTKGSATPSGSNEFQFKLARLKMLSTSYQYLTINGGTAQFAGTGTVRVKVPTHPAEGNAECDDNHQHSDCDDDAKFQVVTGTYKFIVTAVDGLIAGGADRYRIKITDANGNVFYDNLMGASDDPDTFTAPAITKGKVVVHNNN